MNNLKAIILDLDGTLLDDNKKIGSKTLNILKQIKIRYIKLLEYQHLI